MQLVEFKNANANSERDMLCTEFVNNIVEYYMKLAKAAQRLTLDDELGNGIVMTSIVYSVSTFLNMVSDCDKAYEKNINKFRKHLKIAANDLIRIDV